MGLDAFRYYSEWHDCCNREQYGAPGDPWEPIRVDPTAVEYYSVVSLRWGVGRVRGGEWDRPENCQLLGETTMYEGLRQHFEDGMDWEETVYDDWAKEKLADNDVFRGFESIEEFRAERYAALDELAESVRERYRPNFETSYDSVTDVEFISDLEPLVLVGRSGEIIWTEGYHRLSIAKVLGVEEIPVYVLRRHEQWQKIRDEIHGTPKSELRPELRQYLDHPDLQDIVG
ncbi:ParB N-terminal domain-containing protein [Halorussus halophilus]|uniref:hypothetical protein n=1 Tax=Halorussus halophilus TaxID=2650975 RepID=UPI0013017C44|nr:hypothetical protein [Halorussus halophilus]